VESPWTQTNR